MSGLAVIFNRDRQAVDPHQLWQMLGIIPHRGLDGCWTHTDGAVGLGYAKLTVTPEEVNEQQPLVSPRTGCALVADVRLDNRPELLSMLGTSVAIDSSDASLILDAYERWGVDAFEKLLGDFAIAIWDPRTQSVIAARDPGGMKPLYYHAGRERIILASEIKQIFFDPAVPIAPNENRIFEYLLPSSVFKNESDRADTFFEDVQSIPAGHYLVSDSTSLAVRKYWELKVKPIRYRTQQEYDEHFLSLMSEVVSARLRSTSPTGVLLSGGLDSATIACVAQELYRKGRTPNNGFVAFHVGFEGLECDEHRYIVDMQAKYDFDVQFVSPGAYGGRLRLQPEKFMESPNLGIQESKQALFDQIESAGVRVVLTGVVADACVIGSAFVFDSLLRQGKFREFWRRYQAYYQASTDSHARILLLNCLAPLGPMALHKSIMMRYVQRNYERARERLVPLYIEGGLRESLTERDITLAVDAERRRRFSSPAREHDYRILYPPQAATHTGAAPIEFPRPFGDTRIHEFLLGIPPEEKYEPHPSIPGWYASSKQIIRRSTKGILPESVRTRTNKTVFTDVSTNEFQQGWPMYEEAFGPSGRSELAERGYIDQQAFFERLNTFRVGQGRGNIAYMTHLVGLETWLRSLTLPRSEAIAPPAMVVEGRP